MGRSKGHYHAEFEIGTLVHIVDRSILERFMKEWNLHHPLDASQLPFAGDLGKVKSVAFYHGGDELYELHNIPGIWHEACLVAVDS